MSEAQFEKAVAIVNGLPKEGPFVPTQEDQLEFYKYYKQGTVGDVNVPRPGGFLNFVGKAKWDAWESLKGTAKEVCYTTYVTKLIKILTATGDEDSKKHLAELEALKPASLEPEAANPVDDSVALAPVAEDAKIA